MGWLRMSEDEFRSSAEAGLRSLHAEGKVTDEDMADQERAWASRGEDGESCTWIVR